MTSSLPNWIVTALSGGLIMGIFGYLNFFIPKDQKEKAAGLNIDEFNELNPDIIVYKHRFDTIWYLVLSLCFTVATMVAFVLSEFSKIVAQFGGSLGNFMGIIASILVFFIVELVLIIAPHITEYFAYKENRKYYFRQYGVILIHELEFDSRELEFDSEKSDPSNNPRD